MFDFEYNADLDPAALAEFFGRVGWEEKEAAPKVEWAIAASDDWVSCLLEGEIVGFGRTFRLDPQRKIMFDVVVDERFRALGLAEEIMRRLAEAVPTAEFQVFRREPGDGSERRSWAEARYEAPEAPPDAYTGR